MRRSILNGLPVTFVALHIGLCAWTAWVWIAVFNEYGGVWGYEFNTSYDRLKLLDFPVSVLIDQVAFWLASLRETFAAADAVLMITIWLLFVTLGTAQWYFAAIGLRLLTVRYGLVALISSAVLWVVYLAFLARYLL